MDPGEIFEAEFVGAVGAVSQTRFFHEDLLRDRRAPDLPESCRILVWRG